MIALVRIPRRTRTDLIAISIVLTAASWLIAALGLFGSLRESLTILYLWQTLFLSTLIFVRSEGNPYQIFRPTTLMIIYIGINAGVGAYIFNVGALIGPPTLFVPRYNAWSNLFDVYVVVSASMTLAFIFQSVVDASIQSRPGSSRVSYKIQSLIFIYLLSIFSMLIVVSMVDENIVVIVARSVIVIAIFYVAFSQNSKFRWLIVLACVSSLAVVSADSKREAIFVLLPAVFMEMSRYRQIDMSLRLVMVGFVMITVCTALIVAMSILRGYAGLEARGLINALELVPTYLMSDIALAMLGNNFEISYMFFVLHDSISVALNDHRNVLMYGESYLKTFFVGVPEELLGFKPRSIVEGYTAHLAPAFRAVGGSFPPTIIGEAFWNFGWFAFLALIFIFFVLDGIYKRICLAVPRSSLAMICLMLFTYHMLPSLFRGPGFDLVWAYIIVAAAACAALLLPVEFVLNILTQKSGRPVTRSVLPRRRIIQSHRS